MHEIMHEIVEYGMSFAVGAALGIWYEDFSSNGKMQNTKSEQEGVNITKMETLQEEEKQPPKMPERGLSDDELRQAMQEYGVFGVEASQMRQFLTLYHIGKSQDEG